MKTYETTEEWLEAWMFALKRMTSGRYEDVRRYPPDDEVQGLLTSPFVDPEVLKSMHLKDVRCAYGFFFSENPIFFSACRRRFQGESS